MSPQTIRSYRDTMVLFLRFAARAAGSIENLDVRDINADRLGDFLSSLEVERGNSIATRNARLAAMHSFARFLIAEHPEHMDALQQVVGLPFKRGGRAAPIEYLEEPEIKGVLESINRDTTSGRRDYALFSLMFNTGARVRKSWTFAFVTFGLHRLARFGCMAKATRSGFALSGDARRSFSRTSSARIRPPTTQVIKGSFGTTAARR